MMGERERGDTLRRAKQAHFCDHLSNPALCLSYQVTQLRRVLFVQLRNSSQVFLTALSLSLPSTTTALRAAQGFKVCRSFLVLKEIIFLTMERLWWYQGFCCRSAEKTRRITSAEWGGFRVFRLFHVSRSLFATWSGSVRFEPSQTEIKLVKEAQT